MFIRLFLALIMGASIAAVPLSSTSARHVEGAYFWTTNGQYVNGTFVTGLYVDSHSKVKKIEYFLNGKRTFVNTGIHTIQLMDSNGTLSVWQTVPMSGLQKYTLFSAEKNAIKLSSLVL